MLIWIHLVAVVFMADTIRVGCWKRTSEIVIIEDTCRGGACLPLGRESADLPAGRQARTSTMYYVYTLKSLIRNYIYVGLTNDPTRRIAEHNNKKERTTRPYAPFKTIKIEMFETRPEARKREKYLKSGTGKEQIKSLL